MTNIEIIDGFGKQNYGSYVLKQVYQKNATRGLMIGVAFHVFAIVTYYGSTHWFKEDRIITVKFTDINELQSAPPLQEQPVIPKMKLEMPEVIKPVAGIPVVVPDEEAKPDMTIQTQEEIKTDVAAPGGNADGEVKVDITGAIGDLPSSDEPGMNDFTPVEQQPAIINKITPSYPELAKKAGLEGKVIVRALIDENGNVIKAVVVQGDEMFRESAVNALMATKFKPAINGNRAVKVWISMPYTFRLK